MSPPAVPRSHPSESQCCKDFFKINFVEKRRNFVSSYISDWFAICMRLLAKARWFGLGGWSKIYWLLHNVDILPACFQSCKNVPTVPTSWCYFFWPVLIFGKSTRKQAKTRENRRKTGAFLVLIFLWEKLVGANFYAFCNYDSIMI